MWQSQTVVSLSQTTQTPLCRSQVVGKKEASHCVDVCSKTTPASLEKYGLPILLLLQFFFHCGRPQHPFILPSVANVQSAVECFVLARLFDGGGR